MNNTREQVIVSNLGAIARLQIPNAWKEVTEPNSEPGGFNRLNYSRDFSPGDPSATLSVYFRGTLVSDGSASRFQALLHEPCHELTPEEISSLSQVLSKLADEDAFQIRSCGTAKISDRRVLLIEGEWKTTRIQFHGLMVDADPSAREVQEVFLEAPPESFQRHIKEVLDSINSIEWTKE